jgi:hypothetical protein
MTDVEALIGEIERYANSDAARLLAIDSSVARALIAALREREAECKRLRARLEDDHVFVLKDGQMIREEVEPGSVPDGIECRDCTIKLQDERIKKLESELATLRALLAGEPSEAEVKAAHAELNRYTNHNSYHISREATHAALIAARKVGAGA